jgi:hypothetical protein
VLPTSRVCEPAPTADVHCGGLDMLPVSLISSDMEPAGMFIGE